MAMMIPSASSMSSATRIVSHVGKVAGGPLRAAVLSRPWAFLGATFIAGVVVGPAVHQAFARFDTAEAIPGHMFKQSVTLRCNVVKVSDGDTLRVSHSPRIRPLLRLNSARVCKAEGGSANLADSTIAVRICAVDAPETAKFGSSGQPLGDAATNFVQDRLLHSSTSGSQKSGKKVAPEKEGVGKRVWVKLLSRDQYQRAVASVTYRRPGILGALRIPRLSKMDVSEELLKNGFATVYKQVSALLLRN